MITSKEDYLYYRECDRVALNHEGKRPKLFSDDIYKFQILLRQREYIVNCKKGIIWKFIELFLRVRFRRLLTKLGFLLFINTFGPGLSIAHHGTIIVSYNARIGANCRIHEGVTIGGTNGSMESADIGDNVFIASGAKIIGKVRIADNVTIAANAVVVKDILEPGITVGGVPAKKISNNDSSSNLIKATEIVNSRRQSNCSASHIETGGVNI